MILGEFIGIKLYILLKEHVRYLKHLHLNNYEEFVVESINIYPFISVKKSLRKDVQNGYRQTGY